MTDDVLIYSLLTKTVPLSMTKSAFLLNSAEDIHDFVSMAEDQHDFCGPRYSCLQNRGLLAFVHEMRRCL